MDHMQHWMAQENERVLTALQRARVGVPDSLKRHLSSRILSFSNPNVHRFGEAVSIINALPLGFNWCDNGSTITVGPVCDIPMQHTLKQGLMGLCPWRKGPYSIGGVRIESEWDSDYKWRRLGDVDTWIRGKRVLDIGSNSGYYLFRMLPYEPAVCVGIDNSDLMWVQHHLLQPWIGDAWMLGVGFQAIREWEGEFDTVLAMGMLYHRPDPVGFLKWIRGLLAKGGVAIIDTLTVPGRGDWALMPYPRYAKMRNVHALPTLECLEKWVLKSGFKSIKWGHTGITTVDEQRKTDWIQTETLIDFLNMDHSLTCEGYPRPQRSVLMAFRD